jgi:hypothetical protein
MFAYYFGVDEFGSLISQKESNVPLKLDEEFESVVLGLEICLLRKSDSSWTARGFGIPVSIEIFPSDLKIEQAVLCKSKVVGLSVANNTLHQVDLNLDEEDKLDCRISQVQLVSPKEDKNPDQDSVNLLQIVSNDNDVFVLDDQSGIYTLPRLHFRLNSIMKIVKIACGFDHHLILTDTGALYAWGELFMLLVFIFGVLGLYRIVS